MRFLAPVARIIGVATVVALVAACTNSALQSPSGSSSKTLGSVHTAIGKHYPTISVLSVVPKALLNRPRNPHLKFVSPDVFVKGGVYAASFSATSINLYGLPNKNNKAPRCMDNGVSAVNGINVDQATRILWDPDGGSRTIIPFSKNCGSEGTPLSEPNGQPSDVAFGGTTLYVADVSTSAIDVYPKGSTSPQSSLTNSAITGNAFSDGADSGNVFQESSLGVIVEYTGAQEPGTALSLSGLAIPVGMCFDKNHNMIVIDISNGILVYAPPYSGSPTKTQATVGESVYAHLNAANTDLYVGDFQNGAVDVYSYPSLTYQYSITNGLSQANDVEGVAVDSQGGQR